MTGSQAIDGGALAVALLLGAVLGSLYFTALWWTLRRLARARRPGMLLFASAVARLALLLCGFYVILDGMHWERLLAALVGFIAVRGVLVRRLGPRADGSGDPSRSGAAS